jgi:hypothetical protein
MAIPSRQIGWGTEENLLWEISKQLEAITGVAYNSGGGSGSNGTSGSSGVAGTSGSAGTSGATGTSGSAGTSGLTGTSGSSGLTGTSGLSGDRYRTESVSSFTLGSPGAIIVGTGLAYTTAQDIIISYDSINHQVSPVISYDSGTGALVFGVPSQTAGSGTYTQWTVNLNGAAGGDGSSGTSGSSGVSGTAGTSGAAGTSGSAGTSGASGTNGSSGTAGTNGSSGTAGVSGTAGTAGVTGTAGTSGANGAVGGYLGSFYDTTNQTGVAGAVLTMGLNNSDSWNNGVSLVSGSQITIANPGVYNIQFSAQMVKNSGNTATHAHIWLSQNGTNVPTSASQLGFPSNSVYVVAAWNFFVKTTSANEYFQLKWEINSNADNAIAITSAVATGDIPAIPGLIVTVNQVG